MGCACLPRVAPRPRLQAGSYEQLSVPAAVPQGVDEILEALDREEGIASITLGRCVEEKRTVSQVRRLGARTCGVPGGLDAEAQAGC